MLEMIKSTAPELPRLKSKGGLELGRRTLPKFIWPAEKLISGIFDLPPRLITATGSPASLWTVMRPALPIGPAGVYFAAMLHDALGASAAGQFNVAEKGGVTS